MCGAQDDPSCTTFLLTEARLVHYVAIARREKYLRKKLLPMGRLAFKIQESAVLFPGAVNF